MKKLTKEHPFIAGAPIVAEELQGAMGDIGAALSSIEGRLLPAHSVGITELGLLERIHFPTEIVAQDTVSSGLNTWAVGAYIGSGLSPADIKILPGSVYGPGWNSMTDLPDTQAIYSELQIPSTPGRIIGGVTIDSELRCSVSTPVPQPESPYANRNLYWEFAVFANGSEISRSPRLYAGRSTVSIPFMTFSGAEEVNIRIKYRVYFGTQVGVASTARNIEPLAIHNYKIWAHCTSK